MDTLQSGSHLTRSRQTLARGRHRDVAFLSASCLIRQLNDGTRVATRVGRRERTAVFIPAETRACLWFPFLDVLQLTGPIGWSGGVLIVKRTLSPEMKHPTADCAQIHVQQDDLGKLDKGVHISQSQGQMGNFPRGILTEALI